MKRLISLIAAVFTATSLMAQSAQKVISFGKEEWHAILSGNATSSPVETRWGFAILTDGRMLNSCTADGKIIWRRGTKGKPSFITQSGDFFYIVTRSKKITLVNPSGKELWSSAAPFEITEKPVVAKDGRIFAHGKNAIACFGNNGVRKWHVSTPDLANLPTFVFEDGSILLFTSDEEKNTGQTVAKRFNKYGEPLEDLMFSNVVDTAVQCSRGILVALKDGSMGLISEENGKIKSPWVQKSYLSTSAFAICADENTGNSVFLFRTGANTTAILLRTHSGDFLNQFMLPPLDRTTLASAKTTYSGFFVADGTTALEFSEDGTIWWEAQLPPKEKWDFLTYTKTNSLVLCRNDWVIQGYNTISPPKAVAYQPFDEELEEPPKPKPRFPPKIEWSAGLEFRAYNKEQIEEIEKMLKKGDYGKKERDIVEGLKKEVERYLDAQVGTKSQNYFAQNPDYARRFISLLSLTGVNDFSQSFAALIKGEKEPTTLAALIHSAGNHRFDPDGDILTALEFVCHSTIGRDNPPVLMNLCDATFEICCYMGHPSLFKYGKEILKHLTDAGFNSQIREYATQTLKKLSDEDENAI